MKMVERNYLYLLVIILSVAEVSSFVGISQQLSAPRISLSPLPMTIESPKSMGCAAKPYEKKKIAVFGTGGYLGSTIFGFLQRASSIYGTGVKGEGFPRSICATGTGSEQLNKTLLLSFKLAFAGENLIRLTNLLDVKSIAERIRGIDAVVLGTVYQLEKRSVTFGSYEKTPNDKTQEFYMDERYAANPSPENDDIDFHLNLFQNSIDACKKAEVKHLVIIETPATRKLFAPLPSKFFATILDNSGIPFTYIHADGKLEKTKSYTFEEGIQGEIGLEGVTLSDGYMNKVGYNAGDWSNILEDQISNNGGKKETVVNSDKAIAKEDFAAVAVQSLLSLSWTRSRYLSVSCDGPLSIEDSNDNDGDYKPAKILKSDKDWCINSQNLSKRLSDSSIC